MKGSLLATTAAFLSLSAPSLAWAAATPVKVPTGTPATAAAALREAWIDLRLDVRNVTGPGDAGKLDDADLQSRVAAANVVFDQCSIRFHVRSSGNVSAHDLGVNYEPKSQGDLSQLAGALNPHGFTGAIPFTIAGPWRFYDSGSGLFLTGLGWVFTDAKGGVDRIGAMIDSQRVHLPIAGPLIAHELAHALSLPHVAEQDNLMGPGGTSRLTADQCRQIRSFSQTALASFQVPGSGATQAAGIVR